MHALLVHSMFVTLPEPPSHTHAAAKGGKGDKGGPTSHNNDKDLQRRLDAWNKLKAEEKEDLAAKVRGDGLGLEATETDQKMAPPLSPLGNPVLYGSLFFLSALAVTKLSLALLLMAPLQVAAAQEKAEALAVLAEQERAKAEAEAATLRAKRRRAREAAGELLLVHDPCTATGNFPCMN